MRRNGPLVVGALACVLVGAVLVWNGTRPDATRPPATTASPRAESSRAVAAPLAAPDTGAAKSRIEDAPPSSPSTDESVARRFAEVDSLLPLYRELVARANNGDGAAAYYLYKIHETCAYLPHPGQIRRLLPRMRTPMTGVRGSTCRSCSVPTRRVHRSCRRSWPRGTRPRGSRWRPTSATPWRRRCLLHGCCTECPRSREHRAGTPVHARRGEEPRPRRAV